MNLNKKLQGILKEKFLEGPASFYDGGYFIEVNKLLNQGYKIDDIIDLYNHKFHQYISILLTSLKVNKIIYLHECYVYFDTQAKQLLEKLLVVYYFKIQEYISNNQFSSAINLINLLLGMYLVQKYDHINNKAQGEPGEIQLWNNYKAGILRLSYSQDRNNLVMNGLIKEEYYQRIIYLKNLHFSENEINQDFYIKFYLTLMQ